MNVRNLLDIHSCYQQKGGEFWVTLSDGKEIGTIGLLLREQNCAIMKKFFVKREFRSQKIGLALYQELLQFAKAAGVLQSYWIRLRLHMRPTGFMKSLDFAG